MLSRAETGKRSMTTIEVATYTAVCGVTGEAQDELIALAEEPDYCRLKRHADEIPDALRTLIFHESTASAIESVQPLYLPGITQTPEYARALFEMGGKFDPAVIESRVATRMGRREVLTRHDPAQCSLYIHEYALRTMVGSPKVMCEQLLHLIFAGTHAQCAIRVVPASAGAHGVSMSSFQIFHYPEGPPVVYVQNETTCEFLENGQDLLAYQAVLNRVASVALTDAQSSQMIEALAGDYERQGATQHEDRAGRSEELAQE